MNSALKPVLGGAGVPSAGGQASPAKGNVAGVSHAAVGLPQGAQNHHSNTLVGQNLTQHAPPIQALPHAVPSMAPVSANMAQMAQNMSHHGNLSHLNQNSTVPANLSAAASPTKAASTSSPLSLVQDKVVVNASQPLALTRTPEKKEPDSTGPANGTIDSPKSGANAPASLKPQNPEPNKDKQDIAKTSPSTPKPPEKQTSAPNTPQKPEGANPVSQADGPAQPKVATANEPPEKSPSKPAEPTPAPTADIAPSQSDSKPVPESANNQSTSQSSNQPDKAPTPTKQDPPAPVSAKTETVPKVEEKKEEAPEKPPIISEDKKEEVKDKVETLKKEDQIDKPQPPKVDEKVEEKKEVRRAEAKPKSTLKLATVTPPMRKRRQTSDQVSDGATSAKKLADGDSTPFGESRTKRNRTKVQLYQSPTPELTMATKLSASAGRSTPTKPNDDKLIVFYKNEYLAVRNAEGGFYVCQAMQNVYRSTRKIKIRWLSQDKADPSGETYKPDFYDVTDMECVLTTLSLGRAGGGAVLLRGAEAARASSILQRALRAERGAASLDLTPEHPDGLDLSLYTDESQLDSKQRARRAARPPPPAEMATPAKKARVTPKRSPKSSRKAKTTPVKQQTNNNKRKSPGSAPAVASTSKTATAVMEKAKASAKSTPVKRTPAKPKPDTPAVTPSRGRRTAKEMKPSPIVATPSTSTGKTTRTPRKPPSRK